ncbi:MAG: beta-ketoacyl synthase N-terminal-like domain-containing protein [SAR324 cluster bacterium]|nr:beta-ketoacyl synthase N-terminal-like domain-containing protein [SAR324 cluster bacterium]
MKKLPVIIGFGGVNPAGRSSFFHAFRRMTHEVQSENNKNQAYLAIGALMGLVTFDGSSYKTKEGQAIDESKAFELLSGQIHLNTGIRRVGESFFDPDQTAFHQKVNLKAPVGELLRVKISKKALPEVIPTNVTVKEIEGDDKNVTLLIQGGLEGYLPSSKKLAAQAGGQMPTGFDPGAGYPSANHPRGLKTTVYGASDALGSSGIEFSELADLVAPDQIGVYASSAMGQLGQEGVGGYMKAALLGKRPSTKQMALSLAEMPGDFLNAYVLGSIGHTGGILGACASTLYNLEHAVKDIQEGRRRIALVGAAEAPLISEVYEAYRVMGALAEDDQILALDQGKGFDHVRYSHACRPFGYNCGFTLAESGEFFLLVDDELAMEVGAQIFGSVPGVFVNADGYKKSISGPGAGNYVSMAKAAGLARAVIGDKKLRENSFVSAHGTGTPQNRVSESDILNKVAKAFGINDWPVSAVKCYLGHSISAAAGNQLSTALGSFNDSVLPGIFTLDELPDDVINEHLNFSKDHIVREKGSLKAALINSKGFGGNNATAVILSPEETLAMLEKKHGKEKALKAASLREKVTAKAQERDQKVTQGEIKSRYQLGEGVIEKEDVTITSSDVKLNGYKLPIDLDIPNPYPDFTEDKN